MAEFIYYEHTTDTHLIYYYIPVAYKHLEIRWVYCFVDTHHFASFGWMKIPLSFIRCCHRAHEWPSVMHFDVT